jgi:hypothetical protein
MKGSALEGVLSGVVSAVEPVTLVVVAVASPPVSAVVSPLVSLSQAVAISATTARIAINRENRLVDELLTGYLLYCPLTRNATETLYVAGADSQTPMAGIERVYEMRRLRARRVG